MMTAGTARDRLRAAWAHLVLDPKERVILTWVERTWDASTIDTLASIIEKATQQNPAGVCDRG